MELNEVIIRLTSTKALDDIQLHDDLPRFKYPPTKPRCDPPDPILRMRIPSRVRVSLAGGLAAIAEPPEIDETAADVHGVLCRYGDPLVAPSADGRYVHLVGQRGWIDFQYTRGMRTPQMCINFFTVLCSLAEVENPLVADAINTLNFNTELYKDMQWGGYASDPSEKWNKVAPQVVLGGALYRVLDAKRDMYPLCGLGVVGPFNQLLDECDSGDDRELDDEDLEELVDAREGWGTIAVVEGVIEYVLSLDRMESLSRGSRLWICSFFSAAFNRPLYTGLFHDMILVGTYLLEGATPAITPARRVAGGIALYHKTVTNYTGPDTACPRKAVANAMVEFERISDATELTRDPVDDPPAPRPGTGNPRFTPFLPAVSVHTAGMMAIRDSRFIGTEHSHEVLARPPSPDRRDREEVEPRDVNLRTKAAVIPVVTRRLFHTSFAQGFFVPLFLRSHKSIHGLWKKLRLVQGSHPAFIVHVAKRARLAQLVRRGERRAPLSEGGEALLRDCLAFYESRVGFDDALLRTVLVMTEGGHLPLYAKGDATSVQVFGFALNVATAIVTMAADQPRRADPGALRRAIRVGFGDLSEEAPLILYIWIVLVVYPLYIAAAVRVPALDAAFVGTYTAHGWNEDRWGVMVEDDIVPRRAIAVNLPLLHEGLRDAAARLGIGSHAQLILDHFLLPILGLQLPYMFTRKFSLLKWTDPLKLAFAGTHTVMETTGVSLGDPPFAGPIAPGRIVSLDRVRQMCMSPETYPRYVAAQLPAMATEFEFEADNQDFHWEGDLKNDVSPWSALEGSLDTLELENDEVTKELERMMMGTSHGDTAARIKRGIQMENARVINGIARRFIDERAAEVSELREVLANIPGDVETALRTAEENLQVLRVAERASATAVKNSRHNLDMMRDKEARLMHENRAQTLGIREAYQATLEALTAERERMEVRRRDVETAIMNGGAIAELTAELNGLNLTPIIQRTAEVQTELRARLDRWATDHAEECAQVSRDLAAMQRELEELEARLLADTEAVEAAEGARAMLQEKWEKRRESERKLQLLQRAEGTATETSTVTAPINPSKNLLDTASNAEQDLYARLSEVEDNINSLYDAYTAGTGPFGAADPRPDALEIPGTPSDAEVPSPVNRPGVFIFGTGTPPEDPRDDPPSVTDARGAVGPSAAELTPLPPSPGEPPTVDYVERMEVVTSAEDIVRLFTDMDEGRPWTTPPVFSATELENRLSALATASGEGSAYEGSPLITAEIIGELSKLGLKLVPTPGDGNCLFIALAGLVNGTSENWRAFKETLLDFTERTLGTRGDSMGEIVSSDVASMRPDGAYGSAVAVEGVQEMCRINVHILLWDNDNKRLVRQSMTTSDKYDRAGVLLYTNAHYSRIMAVTDMYSDHDLTTYAEWKMTQLQQEQQDHTVALLHQS
uniref:Non-structural protease n=1 Tax=Latid herpesvirus 1 TaxID=3096545 RepID=A0AB33V6W4_9VIRU